MKGISKLIILLVFLFPGLSSGQLSQKKEEKPKYAPSKEKHKNKTDELGRMQGTWMFFNFFGEKIWEIDYVNDRKEGMAKKFYAYNKVM